MAPPTSGWHNHISERDSRGHQPCSGARFVANRGSPLTPGVMVTSWCPESPSAVDHIEDGACDAIIHGLVPGRDAMFARDSRGQALCRNFGSAGPPRGHHYARKPHARATSSGQVSHLAPQGRPTHPRSQSKCNLRNRDRVVKIVRRPTSGRRSPRSCAWELHLAQDDVPILYQKLMDADPKLVDWGGIAMNSFRMEKGIRLFSSDFTKDHSALEAGLDRWVKADQKDFIGRDAVLAETAAGGPKRLSVMMSIDSNSDEVDAWGNEPILFNGNVVGFTTTGTYGHMSGLSLAMGYVPTEIAAVGTKVEVPLLGKTYSATIIDPPFKMSQFRNQQENVAASGGQKHTKC
eukprot:gene85-53_t